MPSEPSNMRWAWPVILSFLFGLLATTLAASLTFWRDFAIVQERQTRGLERMTRHEVAMDALTVTVTTQQSLNAEQQFQLNHCLKSLEELQRTLRLPPGYP